MTWHRTTGCLWTSRGTGLQGLVNLAYQYDSKLEKFFVDTLQVTRLTASLVYDELLTLTPGNTTLEHVKQQLISFSSLLDDETTLQPDRLLERHILPVRYPDGQVKLLSARAEFTIMDREGPMGQFRDMVKTLDFTMEEAHDLDTFIKWAGLASRYLSRMVREVQDLGAGASFRVEEPRYDVGRKAHGILR